MTTATTTTAVMRFAFRHDALHLVTNTVDQALSDAPGSREHAASARAAGGRNRERGIDQVIPGSGSETDIDTWPAIDWQVIDDWGRITSDFVEVALRADVTPEQESWLHEHLLLDEGEPDGGTGGCMWTLDGSGWRDGQGFTPYGLVQVDLA